MSSHSRRGGAWKVAYADFVTALMALFIVLWLVNSSRAVKASVAGYFRDPRGYTQKLGAGPSGAGEGITIARGNVHELQQRMEQALHSLPDFERLRKNLNVTVTGEGLRIDLMETEQGMFFVTGGSVPTDAGRRLLALLARELTRMPNSIILEGHTDARPFRNVRPISGYGNWELSTDRAHAARRLMAEFGIPAERISEVRGYAERHPLLPSAPDDARNRRVSLVVRFQPS
jgi:chemotaxis protein MotB